MEGRKAAELAEKRRLRQARSDECKSSGPNQAGYCRLHNLDSRNLQYWMILTVLIFTDIATD